MKILIMFVRILWLRHRINQLNTEIAKEQVQIDYWDRQNKKLRERIAALEAAKQN